MLGWSLQKKEKIFRNPHYKYKLQCIVLRLAVG